MSTSVPVAIEWSRQDSGAGAGRPALVLLHGNRDNRSTWQLLSDELPDHRRIAFDLPGHGGTPLPDHSDDMDDHVTSLVAELETLDVGRAVVVGHSLGGQLALALAARRPSWLAGLVVIGSAGHHVSHFKRGAAASNAEMADLVDRYFFPDHARVPPARATVRRQVHEAWGAIPWPRHQALNRLRRVDAAAAAASVDVPVLLVYGDHDLVCPWEPCGRELQELLPAARRVLVPDAGHFAHLERAGTVAAELRAFTAGLGSRRPAVAP